jgi:hypothetical protein
VSGPGGGQGAGYLLYVALDELVETFFPALDAIGGRVVDPEEAVLAGDTDIQARISSPWSRWSAASTG